MTRITTITDIRDFVSSRLEISVPLSILRAALDAHGLSVSGIAQLGDIEDSVEIDALINDVLDRCQAFAADAAWEMVLGSRSAEQVAAEFDLADTDDLEDWLYEAEREAVKQGAQIDFTSESAKRWHAATLADLRIAIAALAADE